MSQTLNDGERIVVVRRHRHWSAHFADCPGTAFGGRWPAEAITRLLDAHPERPVDRERMVGCELAAGDDHLEFLVPRLIRTPCPDCQGTGRYVGLQTVEVCRTCGGNRYSRP